MTRNHVGIMYIYEYIQHIHIRRPLQDLNFYLKIIIKIKRIRTYMAINTTFVHSEPKDTMSYLCVMCVFFSSIIIYT